MSDKSEFISYSESDSRKIAIDFAAKLKGGEVIVLNGNLGAGKTFFIKSVCDELGVNNVVSPTFAIVNEHHGKFHFYHFDFYRIEKQQELLDIGFDDYLNDETAITFIEWGELFPELLPKNRIVINIEIKGSEERIFRINYYE